MAMLSAALTSLSIWGSVPSAGAIARALSSPPPAGSLVCAQDCDQRTQSSGWRDGFGGAARAYDGLAGLPGHDRLMQFPNGPGLAVLVVEDNPGDARLIREA